MALPSLRGGTTLARAVTVCGIAAAATGPPLATSASADTVCAFFTSSKLIGTPGTTPPGDLGF